MKYAGILGGFGHRPTMLFLEKLQKAYALLAGDAHTCPYKLLAVDHHAIDQLLPLQMDQAACLLRPWLDELAAMQPACMVLLNNTLHQAFDLQMAFLPSIPFGHVGQLFAAEMKLRGIKTAMILGTKYSMQSGYLASFASGIGEIKEIEPALLEMIEALRICYKTGQDQELAKKCWNLLCQQDTELLLIACTELSVAFADFEDPRKVDTLDLQVRFCMSYILPNQGPSQPGLPGPPLRKVGSAMFQLAPQRYELRPGSQPDAPNCPYGNRFTWIGYDLEAKEYVRFSKSLFKRLREQQESNI